MTSTVRLQKSRLWSETSISLTLQKAGAALFVSSSPGWKVQGLTFDPERVTVSTKEV